MSYAGPDPADMAKCPGCGDDIDITSSFDHEANCIPKVQSLRVNTMSCATCGFMAWDCDCYRVCRCVECEADLVNEEGVPATCEVAGRHVWRVDDGDGYRILK